MRYYEIMINKNKKLIELVNKYIVGMEDDKIISFSVNEILNILNKEKMDMQDILVLYSCSGHGLELNYQRDFIKNKCKYEIFSLRHDIFISIIQSIFETSKDRYDPDKIYYSWEDNFILNHNIERLEESKNEIKI